MNKTSDAFKENFALQIDLEKAGRTATILG